MNTPARLKPRFIALGVDYLVIVAYALCLLGISLAFYQIVFGGIPDVLGALGRSGSHLLGFSLLTLPVGLYFYLNESGRYHATIGKKVAKIKVNAANGNPASKRHIAVRTITKLLPWEFAHTFVYEVVYYSQNGGTPPGWVMVGLAIANILPLMYVAMVVFRNDHRGPHDLVANTIVVPAK